MELLVMGLASLALLAAVGWHLVDVLWARRLMLRRRVVVGLVSGPSIAGVMWMRRGRTLVLRQAEIIEPGPGVVPVTMDGDVVLDRDQIVFVQVAG